MDLSHRHNLLLSVCVSVSVCLSDCLSSQTEDKSHREDTQPRDSQKEGRSCQPGCSHSGTAGPLAGRSYPSLSPWPPCRSGVSCPKVANRVLTLVRRWFPGPSRTSPIWWWHCFSPLFISVFTCNMWLKCRAAHLHLCSTDLLCYLRHVCDLNLLCIGYTRQGITDFSLESTTPQFPHCK